MTKPFSGARMAAYERALASSTDHEITVDVLTLNHDRIMSVAATVMDGQVNFIYGDAVDRTLQITLYDPDHELEIDSDAPTDGALGFDRLLRVKHSLWVPDLQETLTIPVFTGIPVVPERNGDTITIEAHDKAVRSIAPRDIPPYTIKKGHLVVSAIRDGLKRCGETKFAFPANTTAKVAKHTAVGGKDENHAPWKVFRRLARAHGFQLFYDRAGVATLRRTSTDPVAFWAADTDDSTLTDLITAKTDFTTIRNRVRVSGKKGVHGLAQLPATHPFSASRLKSGGELCHLTLWYEDTNIGTKKHADAVAKRELGKYQIEMVDVSFSAVPIFHLDPLDAARIDTDSWASTFRVREATIPLGDGAMTIGVQRDVRSPRLARIRG